MLVNTHTGELVEVAGDNSPDSRALRHKLYTQGWIRPERRKCLLTMHFMGCACVQRRDGQIIAVGKRHGPAQTYFLHRYLDELHVTGVIVGKTLVQVNAEVAHAYRAEARRTGACVKASGCVHDNGPDPHGHTSLLETLGVY